MSVEFFEQVRYRMPHFFCDVSVLEYVMHSQCKSIEYLFEDSRYVVIDPTRSDLSEVPDNEFRVGMSINHFHRTPDYLEEFKRLYRVSSKFIMFSCATAGTKPNAAGPWKNLTQSDFYNSLDLDSMFDTYKFHIDYPEHMMYFWGVKKDEV